MTGEAAECLFRENLTGPKVPLAPEECANNEGVCVEW